MAVTNFNQQNFEESKQNENSRKPLLGSFLYCYTQFKVNRVECFLFIFVCIYSSVLHCASILCIILHLISARALKLGSFFFAAGPCHILGKSSFSQKQAW